jgi:hypothetical protein
LYVYESCGVAPFCIRTNSVCITVLTAPSVSKHDGCPDTKLVSAHITSNFFVDCLICCRIRLLCIVIV